MFLPFKFHTWDSQILRMHLTFSIHFSISIVSIVNNFSFVDISVSRTIIVRCKFESAWIFWLSFYDVLCDNFFKKKNAFFPFAPWKIKKRRALFDFNQWQKYRICILTIFWAKRGWARLLIGENRRRCSEHFYFEIQSHDYVDFPCRRGAVGIPSALGAEDPGSNPAREKVFQGKTM
jgi:hypothetical protein